MLIAEPPRSQGDLHFRLFGVAVRVHPLFWIVCLLLGLRLEIATLLLLWIGCTFVSILLHEMGHVLAFRYFGDRARIVLYSFGGLAIADQGYTDSYGTRSSASSSSQDGWKQVAISLAGPAAQLLLAAAIVAGLYALGFESSLPFGLPAGRGASIPNDNLADIVFFMLQINILWAAMNLFPVYPLDGGQVARELFLMANPRRGIRRSLVTSIVAGVALAAASIVVSGKDGFYTALLFGYLAYQSYALLRAYGDYGSGHGGGYDDGYGGSGGGYGGGRDR